MKFVFTVILAIVIPFASKAQVNRDSLPKIKSIVDLPRAINRFYKPDSDSLKNACWEGCVFIRFSVDKNRQFNDIAFSKATPPFIIDALKSAFNQINSYGILVTQMNDYSNKPYILPFIIAHNNGCGFPSGWEDGAIKRDPKLEKLYNERQLHFNQYLSSLINMMKYTDGAIKLIDCVLLAPVTIAAPMY
jgi:hypothetical protein